MKATSELIAMLDAALAFKALHGERFQLAPINYAVELDDEIDPLIEYAQERSPKGGVKVAGRHYPGGQWIPASAVAQASPEEKAKLEASHKESADKRRGRGSVDTGTLRQMTKAHDHQELTKDEMQAARSAFSSLHRHHEDLTVHRLEELIHDTQDAYASVPDDHPNAEGIREQFSRRLKAYGHMLDLAHEKGVTGKIEGMGVGKYSQPKNEPKERKEPKSRWVSETVRNMPVSEIMVDPARFQFKAVTDTVAGVTDELKSVDTWDPVQAGIVLVWKDPEDGKTYIVNGHHRHELASRLKYPELLVRYIDAQDAKTARAIGARMNIGEGRGTAVDAAKFMRDTGTSEADLKKAGISLNGKVASEAVALTRLSDRLFSKVAIGAIEESQAVAVGKHLEDHDLQDKLFSLLDRRGKISNKEIEEMAMEMASTPKTSVMTHDLFGDIEEQKSVFVERNQLKAYVRSELSKEVNDFLAASSKRRAERLGQAGNVLNVEENRRIAEEANRAKNVYTTLINRAGPISDAINAAAVDFANAKNKEEKDAAKRKVLEAVKPAILREIDGGGTGTGDAGSGETAQVEPARPTDTRTTNTGTGDNPSAGLAPSAIPEPTLIAPIAEPASETAPPTLPEPPPTPPDPASLKSAWSAALIASTDPGLSKEERHKRKADADRLKGEWQAAEAGLSASVPAVTPEKVTVDELAKRKAEDAKAAATPTPAQTPIEQQLLADRAADKLPSHAEIHSQIVPAKGGQPAKQVVHLYTGLKFAGGDFSPSPKQLEYLHDMGFKQQESNLKTRTPGRTGIWKGEFPIGPDGQAVLPTPPPPPAKSPPLEVETSQQRAQREHAEGLTAQWQGKEGVQLLRAPAGGKISDVDGRFYSEGWTMPVKTTENKASQPAPSAREQLRQRAPAATLDAAGKKSVDAEYAKLKQEQAKLEKNMADSLAIAHSPKRDDATKATHLARVASLQKDVSDIAERKQSLDDYSQGKIKPAEEEIANWLGRQTEDGTPEELVSKALAKGVKLPPDVRAKYAEVVQAHESAKKAKQAEQVAGLQAIGPGQTGYAGGWFVRRTAPDRWRMETDKTSNADKGYIEGDAETIAAHIEQQHLQDRLQGRRVGEAAERFKNAPAATASGGGLFGGEDVAGQAGFAKLPNGSRILVTEGGYEGRVGSIVKEEDAEGRTSIKVKLDGSPEPINLRHSAVEPLEAGQSWRTAASRELKAKQGGLFGGAAEKQPWEMTRLPPTFRPESSAHQQALARWQAAVAAHQPGDDASDKRLDHALDMFMATTGGDPPNAAQVIDSNPETPEAAASVPRPDDTPRTIAQRVDKAIDPAYEFARASAIGNMGDDLKGSKRHTANEWRGLDDAEKNGTAAHLVTRDNLLKVEPHELLSNITPANSMASLAAHLSLNAFPSVPGEYPKNFDRYRKSDGTPLHPAKTPEELRSQFFEAYRAIKAEAEKAAQEEFDPRKVSSRINSLANNLVNRFRGVPENKHDSIAHAMATDPYNPVANALVDLCKRTKVSAYRPKATEVMGRVMDFIGRTKQAYPGEPSEETLAKIMEHASDVMEGDSFNKTFGTAGQKVKRFDPSEAYVAGAERKGGRVIDAATVEAGKKFMLENLKLRGLQWGNYVTDDERQHHLMKSSEALADLAEMTGLPDAAISLGGKLGLGIGARGRAGARAHYESDTQVINLTRASGVGSLAHEWGHGLDNFLDGFKGFHSDRYSGSHRKTDPDDPTTAAMQEVHKALTESGFVNRLRNEVRERIKSGTMPKNALEYWSSPIEMFARSFERHIQEKLHQADRENTYLVGLRKDGHPLWPSGGEMAKIGPAMETLLAAIKAKHFS